MFDDFSTHKSYNKISSLSYCSQISEKHDKIKSGKLCIIDVLNKDNGSYIEKNDKLPTLAYKAT